MYKMSHDEMRTYESVVILRTSVAEADLEKFISDYTARIEQGGSVLIKVDNWGKRKLAYEVKGERKATYLCFSFRGLGAVVQPLEAANRIDDSILKSMTIRIDEVLEQAAEDNISEEPESAVV